MAVTQRVAVIESYGERRDCLDQEWATWVDSLDMVMVPVPNSGGSAAKFCAELAVDMIFLTGGNNIDGASNYDPPFEVDGAAPERDATEAALIELAVAESIPLIGWCRGMQMLNVFFGGRLSPTKASAVSHVAAGHAVQLADAFLSVGDRATISVNSFHDFGIRPEQLALPLRCSATSADGLVEGLVHPQYPLAGCQWHPERSGGDDTFNRRLVEALVEGGN